MRLRLLILCLLLGSLGLWLLSTPTIRVFLFRAPLRHSSGIVIGRGVIDAQGKASIDIAFTSAGQAVSALQFDIGYPDQAFAFSVSSGSAASNSGKTIYTSDLQSGSKRILIAGRNQNPIGNGVVAILSIQANQATLHGVYRLAIDNVVASDGSGSGISVSASTGGLVVPDGWGHPKPAND
jgi:hypothetical protein